MRYIIYISILACVSAVMLANELAETEIIDGRISDKVDSLTVGTLTSTNTTLSGTITVSGTANMQSVNCRSNTIVDVTSIRFVGQSGTNMYCRHIYTGGTNYFAIYMDGASKTNLYPVLTE